MAIMTREGAPGAGASSCLSPLERWVFAHGGKAPAFSIEDRFPVLALGGNASPFHLKRKFAGHTGHIPVSQAILFDHVVVYSAHFTRRGVLPATIHRFAGGACLVAITWLDEAQLARMHETQALGVNYDYVERDDLSIEHDGDPLESPRVGLYVSRFGPLLHEGAPIRLAEVPSYNCPLPALTQPAALRFAHRRVAPGTSFTAFMQQIVEDAGYRETCCRKLAQR